MLYFWFILGSPRNPRFFFGVAECGLPAAHQLPWLWAHVIQVGKRFPLLELAVHMKIIAWGQSGALWCHSRFRTRAMFFLNHVGNGRITAALIMFINCLSNYLSIIFSISWYHCLPCCPAGFQPANGPVMSWSCTKTHRQKEDEGSLT